MTAAYIIGASAPQRCARASRARFCYLPALEDWIVGNANLLSGLAGTDESARRLLHGLIKAGLIEA